MDISDINSTSCAFIPVYCYYDKEHGGEIKTPVLIMDQQSFLLKAILLNINPDIFNREELTDQFIEAYYNMANTGDSEHHLDHYDIFPQLVNILHTDQEEISIYICELYENSESYFQENQKAKVKSVVCYKEGIDELIKGGVLEPLTEKILVSLLEDKHITSIDEGYQKASIELF